MIPHIENVNRLNLLTLNVVKTPFHWISALMNTKKEKILALTPFIFHRRLLWKLCCYMETSPAEPVACEGS